jgi:tetratricopeptide (TPR) repeat protein
VIEDALLTAIVGALAGRAADGATTAGRAALNRLRQLVFSALGRNPSTVLPAVPERSGGVDVETLLMVVAALRKAADRDPQIAGLLTSRWRQLQALTPDSPVPAGEAVVPVPRQLPPSTDFWVNRDTQLADLNKTAAGNGRRRVVVLTGPAGLGKTALAVHFAHLVTGRFPDGQLYLNLNAHTPTGPLSPAETLGRCLRSVGVPGERVPADLDERAALWRSLTADRRLLLLLDQAAHDNQILPVLPASPGCLVLVTTRDPMPALIRDGGRHMPLTPLDAPAAIQLLTRSVDDPRVSDPCAAAALVEACGGIPLALAVTAAHLNLHPQWPVAQLAAHLTSSRNHHAPRPEIGGIPVTNAVELAYQSLPDPVGRAYRLLADHPGQDITIEPAAAALQLSAADAARLLDHLVRARLVTTLDGRYQYPAAVRPHAHTQPDPERSNATRQIIAWYTAQAVAANRILTPYQRHAQQFTAHLPTLTTPPASRAEAISWLESERINLVAATTAAVTPWPELAWQLGYLTWPLFHFRRHHADRQEVDAAMIAAARRLQRRDLEAIAVCRQAWGLYDTGHLDQARINFMHALRLADELGDPHTQAAARNGFGAVLLQTDNPTNASEEFTAALELYQTIGDPRQEALARLNLGRAKAANGHLQKAIDHLTQATEMLRDIDPYNHARAQTELGRIQTRAGHPEPARTNLDQALAQMTALEAPRGQALAHLRLGALAIQTGDRADALPHLSTAWEVLDRLGDTEASQASQLLATIQHT